MFFYVFILSYFIEGIFHMLLNPARIQLECKNPAVMLEFIQR